MTARDVIPRSFDFIDAMPGAGKTEFFINRAVALLNKKDPSTNLIYVAPTVRLLIEALGRIHSHPKFRRSTRFKISLVATPDLLSEVRGKCRTFMERPVSVLSHLLGLQDIQLMFEADEVKALGEGHIVMTTHETFVQVPNVDKTGNDFAVLRRTDVIFDEARQCVMESRTARDLSHYDLAVMSRRLFRLTPTESQPGSVWFVYEVTNAPSKDEMLEGFKTKRLRNVRQTIHKLRAEVRRFADRGRASVFLMTTANLSDRRSLDAVIKRVEESHQNPEVEIPHEVMTHAVVTTLLRPTSLFNHYRRVTLTSAFFKDSQMYHFLLQDGHTFRNLAELKPHAIKDILLRDRLLRDTLPTRLIVAPLLSPPKTPDRKVASYRNILTAGLLEKGMVVPRSISSEVLKDSLKKNYAYHEIIDTLLKGGVVSSNPSIQKTLKQFCVPPLWILINECARIVRWALSSGLIVKTSGTESNDCLLVFNVKNRYWHSVPATDVVRTLYAFGRLQMPTSAVSRRGDGATQTKTMSKKCPADWEERMASYLFIDSPKALFTSTPSTKLHGVNLYSDLRMFAHIAALNPTPSLIALYRALLGEGYDIDLDHSIENLVQTLYRTNLRDPHGKEKVLMIVPYKAQARLLQRKIQCGDFTYVRKPQLTSLVYSKEVSTSDRINSGRLGGLRSAEVRSLVMTDAQKKRYRSIASMISQCKLRIKERPSDVKRPSWEQRIKDLTKEKQALVFNARTKEL
jgi:hypothetical protein